jgi:hypothetical protein
MYCRLSYLFAMPLLARSSSLSRAQLGSRLTYMARVGPTSVCWSGLPLSAEPSCRATTPNTRLNRTPGGNIGRPMDDHVVHAAADVDFG